MVNADDYLKQQKKRSAFVAHFKFQSVIDYLQMLNQAAYFYLSNFVWLIYFNILKNKIMATIGVFYGSSTGNSEKVAEKIVHALGTENAESINVEDAGKEELDRYKYLVFGTSTWGIGDMQDDWVEFVEIIDQADIKSKKVAMFGLGDQEVYSDSFVDGMGKLYKHLSGKATIVGSWPVEGYLFDESVAVEDGKFVGLAIDDDNQQSLTDKRVIDWVKILKKEFK